MDWTSLFIGLFSGVLAGAILGFLVIRKKSREELVDLTTKLDEEKQRSIQAEQEKKATETILQSKTADVEELKADRNKLQLELTKWQSDFAGLQENLKNQEEKLRQQKEEINDIQERFSKEFKLVANEVLEEKSKLFKEQNKSSLGELLNPLKERIKEFQERVDKTNEEGLKRNTILTEQIKQLKELNREITDETRSLTRALKGDSKTQGNWGEFQLETILEAAGLEKDVHYKKETNLKTEDGENQRLDYIINLPDDKHLILDSKVSLTAYANYLESEDEEEQTRQLKLHMDSLNLHIRNLSTKDYQKLHGINTPDYVLMFVANEPALTIALRNDPSLYEKALARNLVLVSTTTLLATLRTISFFWKQDKANKNAEKIALQAANLYDKFVGFTQDMLKLGSQMNTASATYKQAMTKLSEGTGNIVRRTEHLKKLGVNPSKNIDHRLTERSDEEEE